MSFVIVGIPFPVLSSGKGRLSQIDDIRLASGVLPLFDQTGYVYLIYIFSDGCAFRVMLQGPVMLALTDISNGGRLIPWGPQKLIYQPADPVLLVQFPEFEHNVVFPSEIQSSQMFVLHWEHLIN